MILTSGVSTRMMWRGLEAERRKAFVRGQPFEAELRARRSDGQYRWFLIRYHPVRDDDGTIIRWYATGTDIDDRKCADDRVRSENLALREEVDRSSMFEEIVGASRPLRIGPVARVQGGADRFDRAHHR